MQAEWVRVQYEDEKRKFIAQVKLKLQSTTLSSKDKLLNEIYIAIYEKTGKQADVKYFDVNTVTSENMNDEEFKERTKQILGESEIETFFIHFKSNEQLQKVIDSITN